MTNIKDVARLAGVSTSTVSRYLRGQDIQAAEAVGAAVRSLDYVPTPAARFLRSGRHDTIGVIVPDISNPFFAATVRGIESVFRATPYELSLFDTDESSDLEERALGAIRARVDGLIIAPANQDGTCLEAGIPPGLPVVLLDRSVAARFDCVSVDNRRGARLAAEHLLSLGHRAIGEISGPLDTSPGRERHEGFVEALRSWGVRDPLLHHAPADFRESGGYQAMLALLARPQPPTAVFSANNLQTIGALKALDSMGVKVPVELSVIGFDDLELATLLRPALTVIDRPTFDQGALAARLLLARLRGDAPSRPQHVVLETRLIERESCGPLVEG